MRLVFLHGQYVLAPLAHDPSGDVLLAAHGIDRHDGPLEIQKLEQLGIAVISLDFSSVATWPKVRWYSTDQALTMCRGA